MSIDERRQDHKDLVRYEFTKQASAYAANVTISDPERVARLIVAARPGPEDRVLEVATGPGYVALGFAVVCREVVGIDLTAAPLAIAERQQQERGITNARFQQADAENLPFAAGEFDVVVCRLALHHVEAPERVLSEMRRVCRPNGRVAVEDLIASEHPERAAYHNRFEILRDPSHTRALPLSEHLHRFAELGLEVEVVRTDVIVQDLERWLANAQTPADRAADVRRLIERDAAEDLSGTTPFLEAGRWRFVHRSGTVVGRKLKG